MKRIDLSNKSGHIEIVLDKEGQEVQIVGAFQTFGTEIKELSVRIIHKAPRTSATTTLKGVAWDHSQLKLSGTIIIEPDAQKTSSFLREQILLLSKDAKAEAIPNLEIEANDVKCSHAATISNLSEEQLFYLMSRGLSRKRAEQEIVKSFLVLPKA
jgi:Fe-S cluster assembly protein SufD